MFPSYGRSVYHSAMYMDNASIFIFLLSIIGGIVLYFSFCSKANKDRYTGFLKQLYDFLTFKSLFLSMFLKIIYYILAIFLTLSGIYMLISNFLAGISIIIFGNIGARISLEFLLILISIHDNVVEINASKREKQESNQE